MAGERALVGLARAFKPPATTPTLTPKAPPTSAPADPELSSSTHTASVAPPMPAAVLVLARSCHPEDPRRGGGETGRTDGITRVHVGVACPHGSEHGGFDGDVGGTCRLGLPGRCRTSAASACSGRARRRRCRR